MKIFSVYDAKAAYYFPPTFIRSTGEAIRSFSATCCTEDHIFYKHAEDYTLFELGEWDDLTSQFKLHATPLPLIKAIECSSKHREFYFAAREHERKSVN